MNEHIEKAVSCCGETPAVLDQTSQVIKDFYDSVALNEGPYDASVDKFSPSAPTESIAEMVVALKPKRILDIGCGMGTTLLQLAKISNAIQLIGVDFSEKMIERAKNDRTEIPVESQRKIGFFTADAEKLPYMDAQFDFAYSECVFNLLPQRELAFAEVSRVLDEDGVFVYTDFVTTEPIPEIVCTNLQLVSGCRAGAWTLERNLEVLKSAGFVSTEVMDFTEDKNKRYAALMANSKQIQEENFKFRKSFPDALLFLENKVNYVLIIAKKQA